MVIPRSNPDDIYNSPSADILSIIRHGLISICRYIFTEEKLGVYFFSIPPMMCPSGPAMILLEICTGNLSKSTV